MRRLLDFFGWGLALLLVCSPRAMQSREIGSAIPHPDAYYYASLVRHIRGDLSATVPSPFNRRVGVPWLAAQLPLPPIDALNVVSFAALLGTCLLLYRLMERVRHQHAARMAVALFVLSFPTAYYGVIGYVDAAVLFTIALVLWLLQIRRYWLAALVVGVALLVKESALISVGPLLARAVREKRATRAWMVIATGAAAIVGLWLTRELAPSTTDAHIWRPSLSWISSNIQRPRFWLSNVLSFGIPGLLLCRRALHVRSWQSELRGVGWLWAVVLLAVGLGVFAATSAYSDGRFLWHMYPAAIPLALWARESSGEMAS